VPLTCAVLLCESPHHLSTRETHGLQHPQAPQLMDYDPISDHYGPASRRALRLSWRLQDSQETPITKLPRIPRLSNQSANHSNIHIPTSKIPNIAPSSHGFPSLLSPCHHQALFRTQRVSRKDVWWEEFKKNYLPTYLRPTQNAEGAVLQFCLSIYLPPSETERKREKNKTMSHQVRLQSQPHTCTCISTCSSSRASSSSSFSPTDKNTLLTRASTQSIKISIIGAGSVGVTTAYALLLSGLASEIVLLDIDQARAEGEVMDLSHAARMFFFFSFFSMILHEGMADKGLEVEYAHAKVRVATSYADLANSTLVILAAGVNQKPGQTRLDLVQTNYALFSSVVPLVALHAPDTILLVATNPVDVLTHAAYELSGFPVERVIGSGTAMDTTRFRHELGKHYGVNPRNVHAVIIGEHGDSQIPVWSLASIAGMRLRDYCAQKGIAYNVEEMEAVAQRTRGAAYDIIQRKGKTNYGVASVLVSIVEPIVKNSDAIVTVSRVGTYEGVAGPVALSMPCKLNHSGAHQDVPLLLDEVERQGVKDSAESIRDVILSAKRASA